ncbi:GLUG motif-containing protein [Pseudomonas paraeruginosa]|uniref:two-partner secretion domain-containing protein n=1 Tax=Pseudomonas paraeruginosa TaxID=2994495 RepID=UPI003747AC68
MNKCYALVWNASQGCWNVASEGTRRRGKTAGVRAVAASLLALMGAGVLAPAYALPTDPKVVAGSGDIQLVGAKNMSINQHTEKLITNWDSFSVGAGERVTFNQPTSTSIALNRVVGTNGSQILGKLDANGKVFLVNPNGVVFGKTAQVNVGGLVVSTQNIKDADFLASKFQFSGSSTSEVLNMGRLSAAEGGSIALLGARVDNQGTILAQMGTAALGAGGDFTLNFDGNGLLNLQVNAGAVDALAHNGGLLKADGGQVLMTARATTTVLGSVVNNQGAIEARSLRGQSGKIILDGGSGKVLVAGALSANALNEPGHGGTVEMKAAEVEVNLATQVNTLASNGNNGIWKISADKVDVHRTALASGGTVHVDTLSRNLATTNIELNSTKGDLNLNGPVYWAVGSKLTLNSAANLNLKLDNLRVSDSNYGAGPSSLGALVGINNGLVSNVTATRISVNGSSSRSNAVGGLVGRNNGGRIRAASVSGTVSGYAPTTAIGGLVGENASNGRQALIEDSNSSVQIAARSTERNSLGGVGGLVGLNSRGVINNSHSQGRVDASRAGLNVGGLVGFNLMGEIFRSSASGQVVAGSAGYTGGLVGLNSNGVISQSQASGMVSSSSGLATGGLVGRNEGDSELRNVKASGNVTDSYGADIGGLIGVNTAARVDTAEATGKVSGGANSRVGGLVGSNISASLDHVIARGDVFGGINSQVGGIAGSNSGEISSADTSGLVSGGSNSSVGGLVGTNFGSIMASSSKSDVRGGSRSRIGGLVGENQVQGRISSSSSEGAVSGDYYTTMGGIAGVNLGRIEYSGVSGKINFKPQSNYGQIYGSLVGENRGVLVDNYVTGEAAVLPPAGVDYGQIW